MLRGYWWDPRRGGLACKRKGSRAFCQQIDLLTLRAHKHGRDALERIFFGEIDQKGSEARDKLLTHGPEGLSLDQRCDFARLLLSLDARRPSNVSVLRDVGRRKLADGLDNDPEILGAMTEAGVAAAPSAFVEQHLASLLEDRAFVTIQGLVDNPKVGGKLINAFWHIVHMGPYDGTLVLSDRPLIRLQSYDHPGSTWVLPLTPNAAFVAVNHGANLERIRRATSQRFGNQANVSSARQAERFIFCSDANHERWIGRYLNPPTTM